MTTYQQTSPSDRLAFHDVIRVTFTAPAHWFETNDADSDWFGAGLANIFNAEGLPLVPLSANPYTPGALSATVDFLYPRNTPLALSDALTALREASQGVLDLGAVGTLDLSAEDLVSIDNVKKVVGAGAIDPGTPAADSAVYGSQGAGDRYSDQQTAQAQRAAQTSWLTEVLGGLGTAGKVAAGVAALGAAAFILHELNTARRISR